MSRMSVADLGKLRERYADRLAFRDKTYLLICGGTGCHATGSIKVKEVLEAEITANNLDEKVMVVETGCNGFCAMRPLMVVQPGDIFYQKIKIADVPELVQTQLVQGKPLKRLLFKDPITKKRIQCQSEIPFFAHQQPRALRNKGLIDPESLDDYIARDGYQGAAMALFEMTAEEIIDEVKRSGLRGRGGAGFPAGVKWGFAKSSPGDIKYVLCNADEGDPGAFMDRSILEADPHSVIEGMIIAAKAIDANQGYIYARTEYPLAIKRLGMALERPPPGGCWATTF